MSKKNSKSVAVENAAVGYDESTNPSNGWRKPDVADEEVVQEVQQPEGIRDAIDDETTKAIAEVNKRQGLEQAALDAVKFNPYTAVCMEVAKSVASLPDNKTTGACVRRAKELIRSLNWAAKRFDRVDRKAERAAKAVERATFQKIKLLERQAKIEKALAEIDAIGK